MYARQATALLREQLIQLCGAAELESRRVLVQRNETVITPATPAQDFVIVHTGKLMLYQGHEGAGRKLVDVLGPGGWVGLAALARRPFCGVSLVAVERSVLFMIPVERLLDYLVKRAVGDTCLVELLRDAARQAIHARVDATRAALDDSEVRLLKALVRFSHTSAAIEESGGITLNLTHSQLADAIGAARETVSVSLNRLKRQNVVQTRRSKVHFSRDVLQELISRPSESPEPAARP